METSEFEFIKEILGKIKRHRSAGDFLIPVDWESQGEIEYPKIIRHPMSIQVIENKIKNKMYENTNEVLLDIQLIWDNCKKYNMEGSDIWNQANEMEKFTNSLLPDQIDKSI
jgi:hypothetical protein